MEKLFEDQVESLYKIQKDLGLNGGTLYSYTNGKTRIRDMSCGTLLLLAIYHDMNMQDLYMKILKYNKKR